MPSRCRAKKDLVKSFYHLSPEIQGKNQAWTVLLCHIRSKYFSRSCTLPRCVSTQPPCEDLRPHAWSVCAACFCPRISQSRSTPLGRSSYQTSEFPTDLSTHIPHMSLRRTERRCTRTGRAEKARTLFDVVSERMVLVLHGFVQLQLQIPY